MRKQRFFPTVFPRLFTALFVIVATLLALLALPPWAQVEDTTPPALTAFSFAPPSIDTTNGSATVKGSYSATDDLSGLAQLWLYFTSPSKQYETLGSAKIQGPTRGEDS